MITTLSGCCSSAVCHHQLQLQNISSSFFGATSVVGDQLHGQCLKTTLHEETAECEFAPHGLPSFHAYSLSHGLPGRKVTQVLVNYGQLWVSSCSF